MFRRLAPQGGTPREVSEVVNGVLNGKINSKGTITLSVSPETTTIISDERISVESVILLSPKTANAASELSSVYFSDQSSGQATITHNLSSLTDRTYGYVVLG
jgi:hypothetical protein